MDVEQRTKLLNIVMSDCFIILINNKKYIIRRPNRSILYKAQLLYEKTLQDNRFNDWMSENECISHLVSIGKWTVEGDAKIKEIDKFIEDQKVELYQSILQPDKIKQIRKQLLRAEDLLDKLHQAKNSLNYFTVCGFAQTVRQQYIFSKTIYQNRRLLKFLSFKLLGQIQTKMCDFIISSKEFRELSRTDPWRSYWGMTDNPFSKNFVDLDYDKRTLITYSKMYDNIHENPECPNDDVIADDDMLDGWMILQRRERVEKKKEKHTDQVIQKLSPKYQFANEIFLPAQSEEEIKQINDMNSAKSKFIKKQRQELIDKQGQVGVGQLPDEIWTQRAQAHQEFVSKLKK